MAAFNFLAVGFVMNIVAVLFFVVAVVLILIVLIQKGKGGGLSSAFGGGGSQSVFGSKTGDFLTWTTIALAALFLILAAVMSRFYRPSVQELAPEATQQAPAQQGSQPAPAPKTAAPSAPAQPAPAPAPAK